MTLPPMIRGRQEISKTGIGPFGECLQPCLGPLQGLLLFFGLRINLGDLEIMISVGKIPFPDLHHGLDIAG